MSGTNTTPDLAGLCERLREQKIIDAFSTPLGPVKKVSTNPDGPEAAAAIESLVAVLDALLNEAEDVFVCMADATGIDRHNFPAPFIAARTALEGASDDR